MRAVQRHYGYGLAARAPALRAALMYITGTVLSPFLRGGPTGETCALLHPIFSFSQYVSPVAQVASADEGVFILPARQDWTTMGCCYTRAFSRAAATRSAQSFRERRQGRTSMRKSR